jgi:hypothetical protein
LALNDVARKERNFMDLPIAEKQDFVTLVCQGRPPAERCAVAIARNTILARNTRDFLARNAIITAST